MTRNSLSEIENDYKYLLDLINVTSFLRLVSQVIVIKCSTNI